MCNVVVIVSILFSFGFVFFSFVHLLFCSFFSSFSCRNPVNNIYEGVFIFYIILLSIRCAFLFYEGQKSIYTEQNCARLSVHHLTKQMKISETKKTATASDTHTHYKCKQETPIDTLATVMAFPLFMLPSFKCLVIITEQKFISHIMAMC